MSVKVREKRGVLYLDVYQHGVRHWESLHLTMTGNAKLDKEARELADVIRAKKKLQLASVAYGLNDPIGGRQTLYAWVEKLSEGRNKQKDRVVKCLPYLAKYPGGKSIHLDQVNPQ